MRGFSSSAGGAPLAGSRNAGLALAAMVGEIADQRVHVSKRWSVVEIAALALDRHQWTSSLRWKESVVAGMSSAVESELGVMPVGPAPTSVRNTFSRASCAKADKAKTAVFEFIVQEL